ncbi:MAG: AAA family ATPase [Bacteroidales bacterium]|nr:AAA family ATPase [Bacteroidales bacterium]
MKLSIKIHKIKCIEDFEINLPIEKGLYAITGQNGSGKSTIVACASSVFFNLPMKQYFGKTDTDASISFTLGDSHRSWKQINGNWQKFSEGPAMNIKGFFEGSLIFGNRFKDMTYDNINNLESIKQDKLIAASDFIRKNLGLILQGNEEYYEKLWMVSNHYDKFKGSIFFYEKNGKRVSQFHMSTGENLLVSVLNSLYIRNNDRASLLKPCLLFLDEIELALHPSSLKRLLQFLEDMAYRFNYAVYFSTHSIELVGNIKPSNIFYIERHADNTMETINPCYPAYATRILYDHTGYDKVILVEDDLAQAIVSRILREKQLMNSKLVHVLPCGGYMNVLDLASDVVRFNLLGRRSSICIILDGDVEELVNDYISKKKISVNVPLNYLPIPSLEKYLKNKLVDAVDHKLFRDMNDYVFHGRSLDEIVQEYQKENTKDNSGKRLFSEIENELITLREDRNTLIEFVVKYLFEKKDESLDRLTSFLCKQMD